MRALACLLPSMRYRWLGVVVAMFLCATSGWVNAQSAPTGNDAGDPPGRVARLSYVDGDLGLMPAGATEWSEASINRPLTTGDRLSTGADGRAELELGGSELRLAGGTDFGFLTLSDQLAQIELSQGTLNLTVRQLDPGQSYEIDTPTLALVVDQPGTFRVDISGDGQSTQVTVFNGNATVYGENNAHRDVTAGRSYDFGDSTLDNLMITDIGSGDAFDAWCSERDQGDAQSAASQYVSDDVVGYQDLDSYGDWQTEPDYGAVWFPVGVAVGWAPYRFGHWVWISPWGWTWVDDLPWGFAPYHYGRWAFIHGAWGWIPGPRRQRPVYAPALVAFVGIGKGPVGWFPLGPGEIYNPWYRASRNYYSRINLTNITGNRSAIFASINSHYTAFRSGQAVPNTNYANRNAPHGFTAISGQSFANAGTVQRNLVQVDLHQITTAVVLARGINLPPTAASLAQPRVQAGSLSTGGFQRPVLARQMPTVSHASPTAGLAPPSITNRVRVLTTHAAPAPASASAFNNQAQPANGGIASGSRGIEPASASHAPPENTQRPGVSFISSPDEDRARAELPTSGLPQVPRFERASPTQVQQEQARQEQALQAERQQAEQQTEQNQQRYEAARRMHDNVPAQAYRESTPQSYDQPTERSAPYRTEQQPSAPRGDSHPPAHTQSQPSRGNDEKH
ncbi:MAG: DUF6600 domain-containing protein [Rhodanobacter sp.]